MTERVAVFIDGNNLYYALKNDLKRTELDFARFVDKIVDERSLVRVYYYNVSARKEDGEQRWKSQQAFFNYIRELPYFELKLGRLAGPPGKTREKGVDIMMAVDMLMKAQRNNYDTAILVSGDGDLAYVVNAVKDYGKHVENVITQRSQSRELRYSCDIHTFLTSEYIEDCCFDDPQTAPCHRGSL